MAGGRRRNPSCPPTLIPLYDNLRRQRFPWVTLLLLALNVTVFIGWQRRVGVGLTAREGGLRPGELLAGAAGEGAAHLLTYMFLHGSWLHLLGNAWFLWVFGRGVEDRLGPARFLVFYLLCGVAGALVHAGTTLHAAGPESVTAWTPLIGASGAISGLLGAYFVLHPRAKIITAVPIVIFVKLLALPAWAFLLVWFGLQVVAQSGFGAANVAYGAHLGGFAAGVGTVWWFRRRRRGRAAAQARPAV